MSEVDAELPTREAVEAFSATTGRFGNIDILFAMLSGKGISLGIDRRLRAMTLLARLSSAGIQFDDATQLAAHLVPILARSADEQIEVRYLVDKWLAGDIDKHSDAAKATVRTTAEALTPRPVQQLQTAERRGRTLTYGVSAVAVMAVVGLVIWGTLQGAPEQVVTHSSPIVTLPSNQGFRPLAENLVSRLLFALPVLLLGVWTLSWRREVNARLSRRFGSTDHIDTFKLRSEEPTWFKKAEARQAFDRLKRSRWFDTNRIDVPRTLAATIKAGGQPTVRGQRQPERPQYVLFVDRSGREEHTDFLAWLLEKAIRGADIGYARYDFIGRPDRLYQVRNTIPDDTLQPFSVVASRHSGERLIILGTGLTFFEQPGVRRDRSGQTTVIRPGTPLPELVHLREFGAKFLFTTTPRGAWGEAENRLGALGLAVVQADLDGIETMGIMLGRDAIEPVVIPPGQQAKDERFLARLERDAISFSSDVPPFKPEIDGLVADLKDWAHEPDVFTLIAAIAAFPKIDPSITFFLGRLVLKSRGGEIDAPLFSRLLRLPWLRDGRMPDWLRIALVNALEPQQRTFIRQVQIALLSKAEKEDALAQTPTLESLVAELEIAREISEKTLNAATERIVPPDEILRMPGERIFFSLLRDETLDPELDVLQPEAPAAIRERMQAPERRWLRSARLSIFFLALLAFALQPWLADLLSLAVSRIDLASVAIWTFLNAPSAIVAARIGGIGLTIAALILWAYHFLREIPLAEHPFVTRRIPGFRDPVFYASGGLVLSIIGLAHPADAAVSSVVGAQLSAISALILNAWLLVVPPQRFWRSPSAEDTLRELLERTDAIGGTLAVAAIWGLIGLTLFLVALPVLGNFGATTGGLILAALATACGWATGLYLARRWALGPVHSISPAMPWMDAVFSCLVVFLSAGAARIASDLLDPDGTLHDEIAFEIFLYAPFLFLALFVNLRAVLGVKKASVAWRPAVNALWFAFGLVSFAALGIGLTVDNTNYQIIVFCVGLSSTVAIFAYLNFRGRRGVIIDDTAPLRWFSFSVVRTLLSCLAAPALALVVAIDLLLFSSPFGALEPVFFALPRDGAEDYEFTFFGWYLAPVLTFWPIFRFIGPASLLAPVRQDVSWIVEALVLFWQGAGIRHVFTSTISRLFVTLSSPWWATPILWAVTIRWYPTSEQISFAPLALPLAVGFAWLYGKRAFVPIALGTLPFLLRIGELSSGVITLGGVWPAVAILFWARFASDLDYRTRLLQRNRLTWPDVALILVAFFANVHLMQGAVPDFPGEIVIDPTWMVVTVAFVVGASRMHVHKLAIVLIVAGGLFDYLWQYFLFPFGDIQNYANPGLYASDMYCGLIALYMARTWRLLATEESAKRPQRFHTAVFLLIASMVYGGLISSNAFSIPIPILRPSYEYEAGLTIALVFGLVGWNIRRNYPLLVGSLILFVSLMALFPESPAGLEAVIQQAPFGELGTIGFWTCVVGYFLFGLALRYVSEGKAVLKPRWETSSVPSFRSEAAAA